jgi:hypothetical protein
MTERQIARDAGKLLGAAPSDKPAGAAGDQRASQ